MKKILVPMILLFALLTVSLLLSSACDDDDDDDNDLSTDDDAADDDAADDDVDDDLADDDIADDDIADDDVNNTDFVDNGNGTATYGATGLMWQIQPSDSPITWDEASNYCDDLSLAGYDDWRLPTLDNFRALIRGCEATMTGGQCPATDQCLNWDCWDSVCAGCNIGAGPDEGCFWPIPLAGACDEYWTSIILEGGNSAWKVWFKNAGIYSEVTFETNYARCVR